MCSSGKHKALWILATPQKAFCAHLRGQCTSPLQGTQAPAEVAGPQPSQARRNDLAQEDTSNRVLKEWLFNVNIQIDCM